jgi:hypothetical protein
MSAKRWAALLVGVAAVVLVLVVAAQSIGMNSPLLGPIPSGWTP